VVVELVPVELSGTPTRGGGTAFRPILAEFNRWKDSSPEYKYKYKWEFVERGLQIVQGR